MIQNCLLSKINQNVIKIDKFWLWTFDSKFQKKNPTKNIKKRLSTQNKQKQNFDSKYQKQFFRIEILSISFSTQSKLLKNLDAEKNDRFQER